MRIECKLFGHRWSEWYVDASDRVVRKCSRCHVQECETNPLLAYIYRMTSIMRNLFGTRPDKVI